MTGEPEETRGNVTIVIELSLHRAMRNIAGKRRCHVSLLYETAVEEYLERETSTAKPKPTSQIRAVK